VIIYIFSSSLLQNDKNFVVYRGDHPRSNQGVLWDSSTTGVGECFGKMQLDGNFVIYNGAPGVVQKQQHLWATGSSGSGCFLKLDDTGELQVYSSATGSVLYGNRAQDPVTEFVVTRVDFVLSEAQSVPIGDTNLYVQQVNNQSGVNQTSNVHGERELVVTHGWANETSITMTVQTELSVRIPFLMESKVVLGAAVANAFAVNGSTSTTQRWGFDTPMMVPANQVSKVVIFVSESTITVPTLLRGYFVLKSGTKMSGSQPGSYKGTSGHDLRVTFCDVQSQKHEDPKKRKL